MSAPWLAIYRHFDDDALAALASTGLVRRAAKDVEGGKVAWIEPPGPLQGVANADGQRVTVDGGGPARARCDCPAPGICKHILATAIWLRTDSADAVAVNVLAEVLALDPAALCKAVGIGATRKAHALCTAAPAAELTTLPGSLLIAIPDLDVAIRFMAGGGFAGMVSEAPANARAALHLLAVATVWRVHDRAFAWPEAVAAAQETPATLSDAERAFLVRVRQLVLAACRSGWSHMSDVMPAQLRGLALSARVDAFPRLAAMLRTLAATTALLVQRDLNADERQAIALAARIHALCHALAGAAGAELDALRGSSRRAFEGNATLELLPLGAHWWEQRSGARGLTVSFWDPASASVMQTALARRDGSDPHFYREHAWSAQSLWTGAGTPQRLAGSALALTHARLSSDQSLSQSSETHAARLAPWQVQDARWQDAGFDDWAVLAGALQASVGLRGAPLAAVLLKPSRYDAPWLDETRQLFYWTLHDHAGATLVVRVTGEPVHHPRIAHLDAWVASGTPILAVLARLDRGADGMALEPVSVVIADGDTLRAVSLDFEAPVKSTPTLLGRLARMLQPSSLKTAPPVASLRRFAWIEMLQEMIEHRAMTGRLHLPGDDGPRLADMAAHLRALGIDIVADAVARHAAQPDAETALTVHYLCQVCAELETR